MKKPYLALILFTLLVVSGCSDDSHETSTGLSTSPTGNAGQNDGSGPSTLSTDKTDNAGPEEDPNNPWVLGFRWSGSVGTEFRVRVNSRDGNYELLKSHGQRPYASNSFDFKVQEENNIFLGTVFIEGLNISARLRGGTGPLKIEMIEGRMLDPGDPFGGVEVRSVLVGSETLTADDPIELEAGKPIVLEQ